MQSCVPIEYSSAVCGAAKFRDQHKHIIAGGRSDSGNSTFKMRTELNGPAVLDNLFTNAEQQKSIALVSHEFTNSTLLKVGLLIIGTSIINNLINKK